MENVLLFVACIVVGLAGTVLAFRKAKDDSARVSLLFFTLIPALGLTGFAFCLLWALGWGPDNAMHYSLFVFPVLMTACGLGAYFFTPREESEEI